MELEIKDLAALPEAVQSVLPLLKTKRHFLFYGQMGAGKTTFISALLQAMGISNTEGSPTYSLINSYESELGPVYHMDLYRLKSEREAFDIGLEEILESNAICLIEWPQLIEKLVEPQAVSLQFSVDEHQVRRIRISNLP